MNLISPVDSASILTAMDDLWDTVQDEITVVKEPAVTVVNISGSFIPGYGPAANDSNFTPTPESKTFKCLTVEKPPDKLISLITFKLEGKQNTLVKVKQDARDYIEDGRKNLNVVLNNRKFNIVGGPEVVHMLTNAYYIYKLEVVT